MGRKLAEYTPHTTVQRRSRRDALQRNDTWTRNEKYHKFFAVFFLIYLLGFITINLFALA